MPGPASITARLHPAAAPGGLRGLPGSRPLLGLHLGDPGQAEVHRPLHLRLLLVPGGLHQLGDVPPLHGSLQADLPQLLPHWGGNEWVRALPGGPGPGGQW